MTISHSHKPPKEDVKKEDYTVFKLIITKGKSLRSETVFEKESSMPSKDMYTHDYLKDFLKKQDFIGKEYLLNQEWIRYKKSVPYTFHIVTHIRNSFNSWQTVSRGMFETKNWITN